MVALLRYVEENVDRPTQEILSDAEEEGLWRGTPFESAETFADLVGSSERLAYPNGELAGTTEEVLCLAARVVEARGEDPTVLPSEVVRVANGLSRYFLVAGLRRQIDSAGRN